MLGVGKSEIWAHFLFFHPEHIASGPTFHRASFAESRVVVCCVLLFVIGCLLLVACVLFSNLSNSDLHDYGITRLTNLSFLIYVGAKWSLFIFNVGSLEIRNLDMFLVCTLSIEQGVPTPPSIIHELVSIHFGLPGGKTLS